MRAARACFSTSFVDYDRFVSALARVNSTFGGTVLGTVMPIKPVADHSRTLTPPGSRIALARNGFAVVNGLATLAQVSWDEVQGIYAYTRFINGVGNLCLDFVLPPVSEGKEEDRVVVNEGVEGWDALRVELAQFFPSMDHDWEKKASISDDVSDLASGDFGTLVPKFTANITEVWRGPGG
jgi:hypothetical protein